MKLYVSSYRVPTPNDLFDLVGKPAGDIRMAIIPNAKDAYIERIWNMKTKNTTDFFASIGIGRVDVIDLRSYSDSQKLKNDLSEYDLIWVNGGNTFMLRYEMRRSGFDVIIQDLLNTGIVYGGESAGLIVAGPTLRGTEVADSPEIAIEVIWDGIGLFNENIWPHADEAKYADALHNMQAMYPRLIELKNSQAYIVNGDERRIVEQ